MRLYPSSKRFWMIGLVLGGLLAGPARGADLAEEIRGLTAAPDLGGMRVGVRIERLGDQRSVVYQQNADDRFKPASNQKLITSATAMTALPADFTYRTILAVRGDDLVIVGSGDPSIGDPRMARAAGETITAVFERWADRLEAGGLTTIRGDLLFDDSIFEPQHLYPNWQKQFKGQVQRWWAAPVGGLNFNDNCVDVAIKPGPEIGLLADVTLIPNVPWIQLENTSLTAKKGEPLVKRLGNGPHRIVVSGSVSKPQHPDSPMSIAITDPGAFFAHTCRAILAQRGIKIAGQTRRQRVRRADGTLPDDVKVVAVHERKLADTLWRVNKSSLNMFAEAILKTLGAHLGPGSSPRVGSVDTGRPVVGRFLSELGISPDHYVFDDGSGLSHDNRVTPKMLATILAYMDRHPRGEEFRATLAVPGEEGGTLRLRMKDLEGKVFAKTGHIGGVSALSGYVHGPDGRRYAFSVLCNDTNKGKGGAAHRLQDAICQKLATWEPAPTLPPATLGN